MNVSCARLGWLLKKQPVLTSHVGDLILCGSKGRAELIVMKYSG
jgi:hypothetical protein